MTDLLCPANRCRTRGLHTTDCGGCNCPTDGQHRAECRPCDGCLPRRLHDGWHVCLWHGERIGPDAIRCAQLHAELEQALVGSGSAWIDPDRNGPVERGLETGIAINGVVVERRREIRAVLVAWCLLIVEDRGWSAPADNVTALGAYIATSADWLAQQDFAHDACDELAHQRRGAWSLLQTNTRHRFRVAEHCPHDGCTGEVWAAMRQADTLLPPSVRCDKDDQHTWASHQWHHLRERASA